SVVPLVWNYAELFRQNPRKIQSLSMNPGVPVERAEMRRSGLIAAGMLLLCCSVAFALNPALAVSQYAHKSWKVREGVFKGSIYAVAQTLDGYLWLGTEFGLVRFDGVRAVEWQPSGDQALAAGPNGALWAATQGGLSRLKGGSIGTLSSKNGLPFRTVHRSREQEDRGLGFAPPL